MSIAGLSTTSSEQSNFHRAFDCIEENNMKIQSFIASISNASLRLAPMEIIKKESLPSPPIEETNTLAYRVQKTIRFQDAMLESLEEISNHLNKNI